MFRRQAGLAFSSVVLVSFSELPSSSCPAESILWSRANHCFSVDFLAVWRVKPVDWMKMLRLWACHALPLPVVLGAVGTDVVMAQKTPAERLTLRCGSQLQLVMDASLVKSSRETELEDQLVVEISGNSVIPSGRYTMTAALQGDLGGMSMTTWKYKTDNLTFRLMTTSEKPEPTFYVGRERLVCKP